MADVKTYNAAEVSVLVGTRRLTGLAEASFVKATRDVEAFTKKVGATGEVTRSKSNNKAGTVEVTLDQASNDNDFLSELAALDEASSAGIVPISIIDGSGTTVIFARQGWVQKLPEVDKGRESGENVWIFDTGQMSTFIGGN